MDADLPLGEDIEVAFAPIPERAAYVARRATESALTSLAGALDRGARAVALHGPSGIGKSLLLRLLGDRLAPRFDVLQVASGALPLADLLAFALGSRTRRSGRDPSRIWVGQFPRRPEGEATLVLPVDDADALSPAAARGLAGLLRNADGSLRVVLALSAPPGAELAAAFGGPLAEVRLDAAMSEEEVADYVAARLGRAQASEALRARLEGAHIAHLHRLSQGNPARLNRCAVELATGALAAAESAAADAASSAPASGNPAQGAARGESALPPDPFGPAAAAAPYQARASTEALLGRLERELVRGRRAVLLRGPGGIGKTTLLRVLETRLGEPFHALEIPYARLAPEDLFQLALYQLGAPRGGSAESELLAVGARLKQRGQALVLLIDDATALPDDTGKRLAALLDQAEGALRAVLTVDDEALGPVPHFTDVAELRFDEPLAAAETEAYLFGRLLHFRASSSVRRRFDPTTIATLHRASAGVPREINRLAGEIERRALAAAAASTAGPAALATAGAGAAPSAGAARERAAAEDGGTWLRGVALLPHIGLAIGIPLALFALWLWLAPLFSAR